MASVCVCVCVYVYATIYNIVKYETHYTWRNSDYSYLQLSRQ
jgi:hypothetical protein